MDSSKRIAELEQDLRVYRAAVTKWEALAEIDQAIIKQLTERLEKLDAADSRIDQLLSEQELNPSYGPVWDAIQKERIRQDNKWGGPEHDDSHQMVDWYRFINARMAFTPNNFHQKKNLVEVAALAIAAIESLDRKMALAGGWVLLEDRVQQVEKNHLEQLAGQTTGLVPPMEVPKGNQTGLVLQPVQPAPTPVYPLSEQKVQLGREQQKRTLDDLSKQPYPSVPPLLTLGRITDDGIARLYIDKLKRTGYANLCYYPYCTNGPKYFGPHGTRLAGASLCDEHKGGN